MKTWNAQKGFDRKWWVVDATDKSVGRIATKIAMVLRGKHRPTFTPHVDAGDFVVVINADKVKFSGNKWLEKKYYRRSRYFGSLKETTAEKMLDKNPAYILQHAVQGMLPKNKLGRQLLTKLKTYPSSEHPHEAQKPEALSL